MSDVFPLGNPPRELTDNYVLHILDYRGPKQFGVCVQHKNENASASLETVMKTTNAVKRFSREFLWLPPSKRLKLIVESGDWENRKTTLIAKEKVNQSTVPQVHIYHPPINTGAIALAVEVKLLNEDNKPLLETIPVAVNLCESHVQLEGTKQAVEHPADNTATSTDD